MLRANNPAVSAAVLGPQGRRHDMYWLSRPLVSSLMFAALRFMRASRWNSTSLALLVSVALSGCSSLFEQTSSTVAAIAGSAAADKLTHSAAVATGIGLGIEALAASGVRAIEQKVHAEEQAAIAQAAGRLAPGEVGDWDVHHRFALEPDGAGQVSVTRELRILGRTCKEIVFTVTAGSETPPGAFLAEICTLDASLPTSWTWALAEPSTKRWGILQ